MVINKETSFHHPHNGRHGRRPRQGSTCHTHKRHTGSHPGNKKAGCVSYPGGRRFTDDFFNAHGSTPYLHLQSSVDYNADHQRKEYAET
ncbi:hypothetical protein [Corynebacterium bovis]|uniref:hypothetical protein n=1 Tax=Corynebacterium bovis TaxID=36808 RepID=UPI003138B6B6